MKRKTERLPSQDIVRISSDNEARSSPIDTDGQSKFVGIEASEDIAEVTGRHDELQGLVRFQGVSKGIIGGEIVDDLGEDSGPIDRVDRP
jgi:hypothetical protein